MLLVLFRQLHQVIVISSTETNTSNRLIQRLNHGVIIRLIGLIAPSIERSNLHLGEFQRVSFARRSFPRNAIRCGLRLVDSVQVGVGTFVEPPARLVLLCTVECPVVVVLVRCGELRWLLLCKCVTCMWTVLAYKIFIPLSPTTRYVAYWGYIV